MGEVVHRQDHEDDGNRLNEKEKEVKDWKNIYTSWLTSHHPQRHTDTQSRYSNRQIRTSERRTSATAVIVNYGLHSSIQPRSQKEQATNHDKHMNNSHDASSSTSKQLATVQLPVRNSKEDEAKEGVESGAEEGQEIAHAGDDLGEDEGHEPDASHDCNPHAPTDNSVTVCMARLAHDAVVDEFGRNIGVNLLHLKVSKTLKVFLITGMSKLTTPITSVGTMTNAKLAFL